MMYVFIGPRHSKAGTGSSWTGPIPEERFVVKFAKKASTLLMSAALVLGDIPGFGLQADASVATGTSKGSTAQGTKEVA
jgi:hypothetical protein